LGRSWAPAIALLLVGASPPQSVQHTPEAQAKLDKLLAGRVAGEPKRCLKGYVTNNPIGIDDHTMLFRDGPRLWRNELRSGYRCDDVGMNRMLVTVNKNMRLCDGDTASIVDSKDGSGVGTCVLGPFVPYTKP
jgi:hypothetical protein